MTKTYEFIVDQAYLHKLNVYNLKGECSFDELRMYAVGVFVTKYKYNNAWMQNNLTQDEAITVHVILALIGTRQAISRFYT